MKIIDLISNHGICEEIDRICGTDVVSYTYKDKTARINDALDRYLELAFKSGKQWSFDDINESSPPIDNQNIVSGTGRYKFGSFTEKIFSLIKLELLDENGKNVPLVVDTMAELTARGESFDIEYVNASAGTPTRYIKYGDFIYFNRKPNWNKTSGLLAYFERALARVEFIRCTVTQADPGVFTTDSAHGLSVNDFVVFQTNGTIPTGVTANTVYWVVTVAATTTFEVASTKGGTAIEITANQTASTHMCLNGSTVVGIPAPHHKYLARYASLEKLADLSKSQWSTQNMKVEVAEQEILKYFSDRGKDITPILTPNIESNK